jgi:hypothetical protein
MWQKVELTADENTEVIDGGVQVQGIQAIVESALALPDAPKKPKKVKQTIISSDPVNHPSHYTSGGIETIDFIEAKDLDYNLGNVIKYITRADKKGKKLEDLKKAQWYLNRAVSNLEK